MRIHHRLHISLFGRQNHSQRTTSEGLLAIRRGIRWCATAGSWGPGSQRFVQKSKGWRNQRLDCRLCRGLRNSRTKRIYWNICTIRGPRSSRNSYQDPWNGGSRRSSHYCRLSGFQGIPFDLVTFWSPPDQSGTTYIPSQEIFCHRLLYF